MKNFRDLDVWHKAHALTLATYAATQLFPKEETYGLTSQMRRAAVSIAANIAEGCGRRGNGEFHRFLQIAAGSASELEYLYFLAGDLHLLSDEMYAKVNRDVVEVKRMLAGLTSRVDAARYSNS